MLKTHLTEAINEYFAPIRARRAELEKDYAYLEDVLQRGIAKAREQAQITLTQVHEALGMSYC